MRLARLVVVLALLTACGPEAPPPGEDGGMPDAPSEIACVVDDDCSDERYCNGAEQCQPRNPAADRRGCVDGTSPCAAGTTCDESADECSSTECPTPDADRDGEDSIACGGNDCDDEDATRYPGATEICDASNVDEDCDPTTFGDRDVDDDGHVDALCCNGTRCGDDCDDTRASAYEGLVESCDAVDNDCDGSTDEGTLTSYRRDADGDGYASPTGEATTACSAPPGFVETATDCDDTNEHVNPATTELCADSLDNNCNGVVDESGPREFYRDMDGDGFGDPGGALTTTACTPPSGYATNSSDCNDLSASIYPGAPELCNGLDDDCSNGVAGGGIDRTEDRDTDGHTPASATCTGGQPKDDCNDMVGSIYGGAIELCNGIDDDCSSGGGLARAEDGDGDGHSAPSAACTGGTYARDDCNDADATMYLGAAERCDRIDSNCSIGGGVEVAEDADMDGHAATSASCTGGVYPNDDCDDTRANVYAGAPEICDRIDDDCSSGGGTLASEDADSDGYASTSAACTGGPLARTDCNDSSAVVHPGADLGTTTALGPQLGTLTGSLHGAAQGTLRPRLVWSAVPLPTNGCGPITYDLQVDDSCTFPGFAGCTFPSPEADETGIPTAAGAAVSHQVAADLPVSTTAPVGRRYYWRVRACDSGACSAWTSARYLDVGRTRSDFDGDGFGDAAVSEGDSTAPATIHVFRGGASGIATTASRSVALGTTLRYPGYLSTADFDADGFSDLVLLTSSSILIFGGSSSGLPATASQTLSRPNARGVGTGGDVNGDGYSDLLYYERGVSDVVVSARFGTATGVATSVSWTVSWRDTTGAVDDAGLGDLDGDGIAEIVVLRSGSTGTIDVYRGASAGPATTSVSGGVGGGGLMMVIPDVSGDGRGEVVRANSASGSGVSIRYGAAAPALLATTPSLTIPRPSDSTNDFGDCLTAGDIDGDGDTDLIIGDPALTGTASSTYAYRAGATGLPTTPSTTITASGYRSSNCEVVLSDVQGDGFSDMLVGREFWDATVTDVGAVHVHHGGASGLPMSPSATIPGVAGTMGAHFGRQIAWRFLPMCSAEG